MLTTYIHLVSRLWSTPIPLLLQFSSMAWGGKKYVFLIQAPFLFLVKHLRRRRFGQELQWYEGWMWNDRSKGKGLPKTLNVAQRGRECIVLLLPILGARWLWAVKTISPPFYTLKISGTHFKVGWVDPSVFGRVR